MLKKRKLAAWGAVVCLLMLAMSSVTVFAAEETTEYVPKMYASFWALVPPVVAIVLALITKEVYSSLFSFKYCSKNALHSFSLSS